MGEVKLLGKKNQKVVQLKIGKDGKKSYNFSPSVMGVNHNFILLKIEWMSADDKNISGALRRYVAALREELVPVELSVADTGVVRIDLSLDGENQSL